GGADPVRGDVLVQLGRLDHLRGHVQQALDRYEAARGCTDAASPQGQEIALRRLLVLLDLNQRDRARAEFARVTAGRPPESLAEEVRGLARMAGALLNEGPAGGASAELRGFRAAEAGDLDAARELYLQALGEAPAPARRARLAVALGMLAVAAGDRAEAERWLHLAEELARRLDLPEVL